MRPSEPGRLPATARTLVLIHLALAVAAVATAGWCFVTFGRSGPDDDPLIGFLVVYGVAALLYAAVSGTLAVVALRSRNWPAYTLSLGVWVLVCAAIPALLGLGAEWWWQLGSVVIVALPVTTIVAAARGLSSRP